LASTSWHFDSVKDVDGRDKPGHDEKALALQRSALFSQRVPARDFRFHRVNLFRSRPAFLR